MLKQMTTKTNLSFSEYINKLKEDMKKLPGNNHIIHSVSDNSFWVFKEDSPTQLKIYESIYTQS